MRPIAALMMCVAFAACERGQEPSRTEPLEPSRNLDVQAASTGGPATIDCKRASGQAEQAVCADKELAALDRLAGPGDDALRAARSECGRADELRWCLVETYATRIAERAKMGSADSSTVIGPVSFRCGGDEIEATFINSEPGYVVLGGEQAAVLPRIAAASGVKYEASVDGKARSFWNKGRDATLSRGGVETSCVEQPAAG